MTVQLVLQNFFILFIEFAPTFCLGLILTGALKAYVNEAKLLAWLETPNRSHYLALGKSTSVGAFLPLCSCGVLPIMARLIRAGVSPSVAITFIIATPVISVASLYVSSDCLGVAFTAYKLVLSVMMAFFTGCLIHRFAPHKSQVAFTSDCDSSEKTNQPPFNLMLEHAFGHALVDIRKWFLIGLILAALVQACVPPDFFSGIEHSLQAWLGPLGFLAPLLSMVAVFIIAIPLGVCAVDSIPLAITMLAAGVSPGTVMVFLVAGPAVSVTATKRVNELCGRRTTLLYLAGIAGFSIAGGLLLNGLVALNLWSNSAAALGKPHEYSGGTLLLHLGCAYVLAMQMMLCHEKKT